jgi:phosphate:Na+ symporter
MSTSLQILSGGLLVRIVNALDQNQFTSVLIGLLTTMIIQSSSLTTSMVVVTVNAGLRNLFQAVGMIIGANVGTTITGWIMMMDIKEYALFLVALGFFPGLFAKKVKFVQLGRFICGLGLIFFGLQIMSGALVPLTEQRGPFQLSFLFKQSYLSYISWVFMGLIVTIIIRSSSALLGLTMVLASGGVIPFHAAVSLVLGGNVGTTITAVLAGMKGNLVAKRTAFSHTLFNLIGGGVTLSVFSYYLDFIEWLVPGAFNFINSQGQKIYAAKHVVVGHTLFNLGTSLLIFPFFTPFVHFLQKLVPGSDERGEKYLWVLGSSETLMPIIALIQAEKRIIAFREEVNRMFILTKEYILVEKQVAGNLNEIKKIEKQGDVFQQEITAFLGHVIEKSLTPKQSEKAQSLIKTVDEMESITDYLDKCAIYLTRIREKTFLDDESRDYLVGFLDHCHEYFRQVMGETQGLISLTENEAFLKAKDLRLEADKLREYSIENFIEREYSSLLIMSVSDMVSSLRKIVSHSLNISQSVNRLRNATT